MRMGPSMAWICPLQPARNDRAFHRPNSLLVPAVSSLRLHTSTLSHTPQISQSACPAAVRRGDCPVHSISERAQLLGSPIRSFSTANKGRATRTHS